MLTSPSASRRDYGSGSLTEIAPKVWRLRAPAGKDAATGRTRQVGYNFRASKPANRGGKGEALEALRKLVTDVEQGRHVGTSANFETLATEYLAHVKRTKGIETYDSYRVKLEKTIVPELGPIKLSKLTAHDLDSLYAELERRKLASTTIEHTHNVISGTLTQGIKWGWISTNVAKMATPPKAVPKTREALTPEQITVLIKAALELDGDAEMAVAIFLLCLVGGRRGEACGFQWGDVDWERQAIRVERQIVPTAGGQRIKPPKGDKKRTEAIGDAGVQLLMGYQATLRKRLGEDWKPAPSGWIISIDGGETPIRAKGVTSYIKSLGDRCQPKIDARPHDFRRFSVTQLFGAGVDSRTIQERHGHSSLEITEGYALSVPARDQAAAEAMGIVLFDALEALENTPKKG